MVRHGDALLAKKSIIKFQISTSVSVEKCEILCGTLMTRPTVVGKSVVKSGQITALIPVQSELK